MDHDEATTFAAPIVQADTDSATEPTNALAAEAKATLAAGLAMSAACIGTVMIASTIWDASTWSGLHAITSGVGLSSRRPSRSFRPALLATSLGVVVGGSLAVAALSRQVGTRIGSPVAVGLIAGAGSYLADKIFMRKSLFSALNRTIGPLGAIAKYGAMGVAAFVAARAETRAAERAALRSGAAAARAARLDGSSSLSPA